MKKMGWLFTGQGSQTLGMGKAFYDTFDFAKDCVNEASEALGFDIAALMFEANDNLDQTEYAQPAILTVSMMALRAFRQTNVNLPVFALGHSLGEISALCAVGALPFADAVKLVHERGKLMKAACEGKSAGMMAVLALDDTKVEEIIAHAQNEGKKVWCANYNMDGQLVLAGVKEDLSSLEATLKEAGAKRALLLNMSVASHCPLLESAVAPLQALVSAYGNATFSAPVISNVTAKGYATKEEAIELLGKQLVSPVLYKQALNRFSGECDVMIEFGGKVLAGMNKKASSPTFSIIDPTSLETALCEVNQ